LQQPPASTRTKWRRISSGNLNNIEIAYTYDSCNNKWKILGTWSVNRGAKRESANVADMPFKVFGIFNERIHLPCLTHSSNTTGHVDIRITG
jgi:hypothetical protein